jgi:tetratricopeptide (TPR) repeat protein
VIAGEAAAGKASRAGDGARIVRGAFTALLEELARAPSVDLEDGWERTLAPGTVVGRFELVRQLGHGGCGVVFEAQDRELGRRVAFKAFRPGSRLRQIAGAAWLEEEAEAVARLNHPNIVTLHDVGRCEAGPYLIMELLRGVTLAERLRSGPLPPAEAVRVALAIAAGVAHAHAAGVVHRDLKPENVFIADDGAVKVLDFGIAHVLGRDLKAAGTPAFMPPEQRRGESQDQRTDVYAVGALLLVMLGGDPRGEAGAPPRLPTRVPPELARVIARALRPDRAERPRDGAALLADLRAAELALPGGGRHRARRRRVRLALAVLAAVTAGAGAGQLWRHCTAPKAPVAVAVADIYNETGEEDLDGLAGMLSTSLEQSRVLDVVTRARLVEIARKRGGEAERIDAAAAREAGKAAGVRALLLGVLRPDGNGYALRIDAVDPVADRTLFAVLEHASARADIPALVDRVSAKVRRELRERMEDVHASEVRVARAITGSLEAYQHYFEGQQCSEHLQRVGAWRSEECAVAYRRALAIDPTFALAHYALALGPADVTPTPEQHTAIAEAVKHTERVPEKERLLIRAWAAHLDGRDADALALYRVAIDRFPHETPALFLAGDLLHHRSERALAVPFFERVVALHPAHAWALDHLVDDLAHLGERGRLRRLADDLARAPRGAAVLHALSEAYGWLGDVPGAVQAARREVEAGGGTEAREDVAKALLFAGDFDGAEVELRDQLAAAPGDPYLNLDLAAVLASQGRRREGFAHLRRLAVPESDDQALRVSYRVGDGRDAASRAAAAISDPTERGPQLAVLLAFVGDLEGAARFARRLEPGSIHAQEYQGIALWRQHRHDEALAILRAAERLDRTPATIAPAFVAAEIAAAAGRDAETVESIGRFHAIYEPLTIWRSWAYPRSLVLLARCQDRLGRVAESRAALARFLAMWRRADKDAPLLAEARALDARLAR